MGALVSLASVALGLLRVVICGSPVGVEAFMDCDSDVIQEVDLGRKGIAVTESEFQSGKHIVVGHYGHMISWRALLDIAVSDATCLVLIVDYPIM